VDKLGVQYGWLCVFFPFIGVILTPLLAKIHPKLRDYGALFFSFLAAFCSVRLLPYLFQPSQLPMESAFLWLSAPIDLEFGVLVDPLSIILANVVAVISFFIMVYSLGYMKGDPSITRYWMLMNLFIGSMLLLVLSNNLLFLFVGWKLVGLCSYALIGFYYKDEKQHWIGGPPPTNYCTPSHAGLKALVMTSAGDVFLLGGILIIFFYAKTFNLLELYQTSSIWIPAIAKSPGIIILLSFLLLAGPVGKSAQFPLHEWLPEAMAGPTPVSALIHAATMVKSGVYLVARLVPIFYYAYWVAGCNEASLFFFLTVWIGAITAFVAAIQGLVSLELKKALAYSTVSQIGYMWVGLGVAGLTPFVLISGFTSGVFHLMSHALFKACLFLCAGSILHSAHSIYMHHMGGLRKYMPLTWIFMSIAALSLMGVPPFPGFWSKDAVLVSCLEAHNYLVFIPAVITVLLTSFYTVRFMGMIFHGPESENIKNLRQKEAHLGDGYTSMWFACGILAVGIVIIGILGPKAEHLLKEGFEYSLIGTFHLPIEHPEGHSSAHSVVFFLSIGSIVLAAVLAYLLYISHKLNPKELLEKSVILKASYNFFWNRWLIDAFYYRFFVHGIINVSNIGIANTIENTVDLIFHKFLPSLPRLIYEGLIELRTERRQVFYNVTYVLIFFIFGLLILFGG
jgi:NADH-quinone oxidoreductase subunit L